MSILKKFYPDKEFNTVLDITPEFLKQHNIEVIFLDIDNTLIDYEQNVIEGLEQWTENLKKKNIKFCIVSNTNKIKKAEKISKMLSIPYINLAIKPFKIGFKKAKNILKTEDNKKIAVVGDQVMTDIFGANRCGMYSILVKPLQTKDIFVTRLNRILEKKILKHYHLEQEKNREEKINVHK